ncbi:MAG TPA: radical SAM/SPASM domain-containing protein [Ktedonobacteraceae bacterium]|nr:radical SAM/SPASM domain-containing protein [Ktedonobacteraceae bacterium]
MVTQVTPVVPPQLQGVKFAWLEITPSCTLTCKHCYVASMPGLGHGRMKQADWFRVLDQLKAAGCPVVQFIGGEPTIHPSFCELVEHAATLGFTIEVYSNLVGVTERMWNLFTLHDIHLATSFYTDDAAIHDEITAVNGSFEKTLGNIRKALALSLHLRIGMVDMQDDQRIEEGKALLQSLGVTSIGTDRIRGVGRGNAIMPEDPVAALCGACARGKIAVTAEGTAYPCVFSRSFPIGNVLTHSVQEIVSGERLLTTRIKLQTAFALRDDPCTPDDCKPLTGDCDPDVEPCDPGCNPKVNCDPVSVPPCEPDICKPMLN